MCFKNNFILITIRFNYLYFDIILEVILDNTLLFLNMLTYMYTNFYELMTCDS